VPPARGPATRPSPVPSASHPQSSLLPPATGARPQPGSSLPPAKAPRPSTPPAFASGLAAAYSSDSPASGLGALDGDALSLSALDGSDDEAKSAAGGSFSPPLPASIGPAPAKTGKPEKPKDVPLDLFAPPDAQPDGGGELELALEEDPRQRATTPPPMKSGPISTPLLQKKSQPMGRAATPVTSVVALETPRWRFAAGVVLAVLIGFVPAHVVASMREDVYDKIDKHVTEIQGAASRPDALIPVAKLDEFRDQQLARKEREQRNIALLALGIWAAAGGAFAYVWFKRIPWNRLPAS
jgi:hypothetical protein